VENFVVTYGKVFALIVTHYYTPSLILTMSVELMINALRLGNTGREILNILDALVSDEDASTDAAVCQVVYNAPTADVIEF